MKKVNTEFDFWNSKLSSVMVIHNYIARNILFVKPTMTDLTDPAISTSRYTGK